MNSRPVNEVSWQPSTTKVSSDEFGEVIAGHNVVIFHFYASWNRYDVAMDQILCEIAGTDKDDIFIGSIDTDDQENCEKCKELRILNLPAIAAFVNGRHFETVIGLLSKNSLNTKVQEWSNTAKAS
jgi:thioredoxin-like negative regulator of GroEL